MSRFGFLFMIDDNATKGGHYFNATPITLASVGSDREG